MTDLDDLKGGVIEKIEEEYESVRIFLQNKIIEIDSDCCLILQVKERDV